MYNNIIIEFNGLPGSGKTTIVNTLINSGGLNDYSLVKSYYPSLWSRHQITTLFNIKCLRFNACIERYCDSFDSDISRNDRLSFMNIYRSYCNFLNHKGNTVLIKDQGLVQSLLSIAHDELIATDKAINAIKQVTAFLKSSNITFIRVDCQSNSNISFERIHNRETNYSRLDKMEDDVLSNTLSVQSSNLRVIRQLFDEVNVVNPLIIQIDTTNSPQFNASLIVEKINCLYR